MPDENPVLAEHPNSAFNAFVMMRFVDEGSAPRVLAAVRSALGRYGIRVLRADDKAFTDSLWSNVTAYMSACDLGVAVFEQLQNLEFNPNVSLELGYMLALGRKVLLLKDRQLPLLPSDILGHLYKEFDRNEIPSSVARAVGSWLRDIGIAKSPHEKLVLFVSYGGTCRCAMSKVVARRAFAGRTLPFLLRFESMAAVYGNSVRASMGARRAVQEAFGDDLLSSHRVMKRNRGIIQDADLILVMNKNLAKGLPIKKTYVITEFFGSDSSVENPWPDTDPAAEERYRECLSQLRDLIEPNADRLLQAVQSRTVAHGGN